MKKDIRVKKKQRLNPEKTVSKDFSSSNQKLQNQTFAKHIDKDYHQMNVKNFIQFLNEKMKWQSQIFDDMCKSLSVISTKLPQELNRMAKIIEKDQKFLDSLIVRNL